MVKIFYSGNCYTDQCLPENHGLPVMPTYYEIYQNRAYAIRRFLQHCKRRGEKTHATTNAHQDLVQSVVANFLGNAPRTSHKANSQTNELRTKRRAIIDQAKRDLHQELRQLQLPSLPDDAWEQDADPATYAAWSTAMDEYNAQFNAICEDNATWLRLRLERLSKSPSQP